MAASASVMRTRTCAEPMRVSSTTQACSQCASQRILDTHAADNIVKNLNRRSQAMLQFIDPVANARKMQVHATELFNLRRQRLALSGCCLR